MQPRLFRLCVAAVAAIGFLAHTPHASADNITLELTGGGNGYNGGGPFHWTQTTPANTNYATNVTTYCIDVQKYVPAVYGSNGTHQTATYSVTSLNNAPTIVANNPGTSLTTAVNSITTLFDHYYSSSMANSIQSAAFQLALWDLVYGATNSTLLNSGAENGDTAQVVTEANYLLSGKMYNGQAYNGVEHDLASASLVALVSGSYQDQVMIVQNPTTSSVKGVPAPPAVLLAGIGVLALFGRTRLTRRTPAAA